MKTLAYIVAALATIASASGPEARAACTEPDTAVVADFTTVVLGANS